MEKKKIKSKEEAIEFFKSKYQGYYNAHKIPPDLTFKQWAHIQSYIFNDSKFLEQITHDEIINTMADLVDKENNNKEDYRKEPYLIKSGFEDSTDWFVKYLKEVFGSYEDLEQAVSLVDKGEI